MRTVTLPTRCEEADVVRGVALLGLCVVNMPILAGVDPFAPADVWSDRLAAVSVAFLFQGKFFVLFSFLFGWGFAIQRASARRHGRAFGASYMRRLACLLLIGICHALLVFDGDVLVLYALMGFALWTLRDTSPRRLLAVAIGSSTVAALALALLALLEPTFVSTFGDTGHGNNYHGTFRDVIYQRWADWPLAFVFVLLFNGPLAFGAFCMGLAAAKYDFFSPDAAAYHMLRQRLSVLLIIGVVANALYALASVGVFGDGFLALLAFMALALGAPSLSCVYLIAIVEYVRRRNRLRSLAHVGRLSLSAYVGIGVLAGFLCNGYGLGLYGQLGEAACLVVAGAVFALIYGICLGWSRTPWRGPLESLLRTASRTSPLQKS